MLERFPGGELAFTIHLRITVSSSGEARLEEIGRPERMPDAPKRGGTGEFSHKIDVSTPRLASLIPAWKSTLQARGIKPGTITDLVYAVSDAMAVMGWVWPSQIEPSGIVEYLNRKAIAGSSGKTRRGFRNCLLQFSKWLMQSGYLEDRPFEKLVPNPKLKKRRARYVPTKDEVVRLILAASMEWRTGDRWLVYLLAACTGLRVGTLAALTWEMVHLERMGDGLAWLELPGEAVKNGEETHIWLTRECAERLTRHKSCGARATGFVFANVPKPDSFTRDIKRAGMTRQASPGSPTFTRHSLRHFYKTWMESMSAYSIGEMQQQMGHLTPEMTRKVYGDVKSPMLGMKIWIAQPLLPYEFTGNRGRQTPKTRSKASKKVDNGSHEPDTHDAKVNSNGSLHPTNSTPAPRLTAEPSQLRSILGAGVAIVDSERSDQFGLSMQVGSSNLPTPIQGPMGPDLIAAFQAVIDAQASLIRALQNGAVDGQPSEPGPSNRGTETL